MKRVFVLLIMLACFGFSEQRQLIVAESVVSVSATAALYDVPANGYLELFSNGKAYVSTVGVTPDTRFRYISAGANLDTESFYYIGNKIGLKSDSGTVNVVFTTYR